MQQIGQKLEGASAEVDGVAGPANNVRSCTKGGAGAGERYVQERAVLDGTHDKRAKSKKSVCFEVVLSCNGYDYLGP